MTNVFNYIDRPSPIHRLTGAAKLVSLLLWSFAAMLTYDTRLLALLAVLGIALFPLGKIRLRDVRFMLGFTVVFLVLNNVLIFLISPLHGVGLYGSKTVLFTLGWRYEVTREQLFYHFNLVLKYLATIPIVLLFVCTTNPSEFAASLNRIGVSYRISYAVALALRYIPDIQAEYRQISQAQQARGIELGRSERFLRRLRNSAAILIPLILSSMERIEVIANAMELRGFGKHKKRTWYMGRPFTVWDVAVMVFCLLLLGAALFLNIRNGSRFWNPFS